MPVYRLKSDILGVDFGVESQQELTERDYFDILKTKVQPQDLLHAYKSAPYDEKRQNLATKALDNGFFDQDVGFTESMAEVGGMVGQGIGDMLTTNIYATSRLQRARMQYGDADTEQVYQPLIEEGIKKAGQQLKGLAYAAKRADRSIEDDLSQAMQFAGIPRDDENLQKRVIAEAQRQDQSQVAATQAQMGVEAAGMMAMIGAKGNEVIERVKADSSKESKLAQIEYLADKFDIAEKIEKGAELGLAEAGLLGTLTNVYLGKNLSPFDVNQEALEDVQSGLVEPDREVALVGSVVADPSFVATMGAAGGVNAMRNVLARGMVIRTGEKAAQESSLRLFLSRAENIAKPSTQQKVLIKSAEQKLAKVAGSGEKLDKLVAKSQGVAQAKVGSLIQSGEASTQSGARLVNSLSKALENAPAPKAPIFNRMTGKILERAGMTTETLGRTIEFIQRLPEETLTTLFMKTGGMSQEAALTAARGTARTLQAGAAAGVVTGGFNEFSPDLENLGLALLLAPGGSSLITRFGHDAAILGKQLQFAQASSPLFQRIAQLDPADASLTSVIIDRSSALTIPETISGLAEGIFSKSRQFGPSPALKVPSTALAKTGLGNTLTGAVNTAKTVVGASTIPGAIGYALDGEAGAGGAIGASWPFLAAGLGMGTLVKFGSKSDLYMKMAGDEAYFKDTYLDSTDRASYESQPRIVRQAIATSNIQNPDVIFRFKEGKPPPGESSNFSVENGESVITIYGKSHPQEVLSAIFGHEIAHHIDTFGFMPQIIDELIGSVEKGKPGVYTEFKNGKPVIIKNAEGREVYATNKEFQKHRQQYLDRLEAGGIDKNSPSYKQYANNDAQIAREIFAAHGADWYFGGEFVNKNWQGAGSKMMGAMLDPLFGSTGLKKFFHRIGLATSEQTGLVADPTNLFPGLKEVPALTRMIEKYNSDVRGYGPQARREGRGRGNLVDPAFKDEVATVNLTAKDLENPAIVNRLKAGGVVKIKDDGTIETDVEGRPVFLPTREVNKNNKKLSNDILEIIRKKEDAGETFGEGHVSLEKTVDGRDRATGVFIDPSIIDQLQGKYNPHQLAALKQINQTLRNGTGDVWDLFYYSALKYNKAGRKVYGQIKGGDRSSLPFGIEITKDGNINIQTISMDAFIKNLEWFAKSKGYSQKMAQAFGGMNPFENTQAALKLLPKYLQNHLNKIENGTPESGITVAQRDLINGAIGRMNADQVKANPVLEGLGDRRSQRQQSYRSRRLDRIGNAVRGEPGYPAVKSAIEQNKLPMRIPAFHGTPHTLAPEAGAPLGKFRTSKIGTGEGAQAYGHGLYFAGRKEVAEHYRNALSSDDKLSAKAVKKYAPRKREIEREIRKVQDELGQATTPQIAQEKARRIKPFEAEINSINAKIRQESADGSLYKVELAPKENEYLLWDKPLSEQPKGVREKLKPVLDKMVEQLGLTVEKYSFGNDYPITRYKIFKDGDDAPMVYGGGSLFKTKQDAQKAIQNAMRYGTGQSLYNRMETRQYFGGQESTSAALKEAGIPGIKYLDGASRSKGEGDYNYVIFDEADVTVTEKLFMPQMAMKSDPSVKYHYDTQTMDRPPVKDVSALSGERLAGVLEADRHDARGGRMAGPAHPFLKSNQATATVDGIKWKPVWANMKYQFVKTQIGKQMKSTNGYNLVAIMDEFAHRSNRDVFTRMMKKIQSASKKMTPEEKLVTAQIINIFDIRYTPKKERGNKLKESMLSFVSDLGTAKSQATRNNMEGFNKLLKKSVDKVKSNSWWDSQSIKSNSKDFRKYTKDMTFNKRGAILKALEGLPWLPDIQKFLKSEMDFEGAPTDKAVLAVQLSKHKLNSDERVFAIYTGKDPDQARWMTKNEREVLRQLRADPNFREHPSYDWMMLGKADSDNFYLDKPVNLDKLIPTYRRDHKRSKTQEYKAQLSKTKNYLSKTPKSKGFLFSGKGDKADNAFLKTFSETKSKKAGIENVYKGKERLVVGAMKRNAKVPIIIP